MRGIVDKSILFNPETEQELTKLTEKAGYFDYYVESRLSQLNINNGNIIMTKKIPNANTWGYVKPVLVNTNNYLIYAIHHHILGLKK